MRIVNVHEAKTTLSRLLEEVEHGETIVIARNGKPVAELTAVEQPTIAEIVGEIRSKLKLRTAGINIRDAINEGRR